ncbi:MAG: AMP-binding protein [Bdellovibrionales bacterium]|nr:AMP-binding protein [Bdellovibrionales bacterium]
MSFYQFLHKSFLQYGEREALIDQFSGKRLTYKDLEQEVSGWANYLNRKGIRKGDRVVYIHTNSLEHVILFLACSKIGALFVPMNWRLGVAEIDEILNEVDAKIIFYKDKCELTNRKEEFIDVLSLSHLKEVSEDIPKHEISLNEPLLMLYTSGTTGKPKGVLLHGSMLQSNILNTVEQWGLREGDRTIVETPFFHTGGYNVLLLPLLSVGGTCILAEKFDVSNFYKTLKVEKLSVYFGVPTMFQHICENPEFESADFKTMRFLISGGAYCSEQLISTYQKKQLVFKQGFGLTEVGPNCFLLKEEDAIRKIGSIGQPMPHSKVRLMADGREAKVGEVGELLLGGPHVCRGYYKNSEGFESSLTGEYFKTGDLARKDEEGFYYIEGRKKDMYISGGENVYPAEVEGKLAKHEFIDEAVVVAQSDEKWGEVGVAFYRGKRDIDLKELREFLNPILSRYKHPHRIVRLEEFPLLDNGKVNRIFLKESVTNY